MTYANGNGPGAISVRQQPPRNSLDYWNKSEDWQGVTTYYRSPNGPRSPYGMENIYAQSPTRIQRPAPFPLNLPVSKPSEARRLPQTRSPSAPEGQGTYQNVPVGSRARQEARKPSPPKDSPIFTSKTAKQGPESLIWSAAAPTTVPTHHNHLVGHHHNNHVAPVSNSPQITRVEVRGPGNTNGAKDHHRSTLRRKPKWGSLVRSLCCCISQDKADRNTFAPPPSSSLPITQVQKNGSAYPDAVPPHYQPHQRPAATAVTIPDKAANNDYTPSPIPVAQPSPLPKSNERHLLPQLRPADSHKKCLIIDLDETLVHSSFKPVKNADFVIPVEIDGVEHKVYVLKRPYVDEFLERVGERFECVLFTASLAKYADPVADLLDKRGVFRARLFREACVYHKGNYVKDLARLGRDLNKVIIIDNSPASYAFHPENAIPVQTWFDDPTDCELLEILPLLERMERIESVYQATRGSESPTDVLLDRS